MTCPAIHITEHAFQRARERLGLNRPATERLVARAFDKGLQHAHATGALKRYLDGVFLARGTADNLRVYGEAVWVLTGTRVITVLRVPLEHRSAVRNLLAGRKARGEARP